MDAAGLPALQEAIRHMYGLEATWLETVPVHETFQRKTVWAGEVEVFAVKHPKTTRCYAWSHEATGTKRRFHAVLGVPPINSPLKAVQASIVARRIEAGRSLSRFGTDYRLRRLGKVVAPERDARLNAGRQHDHEGEGNDRHC